ncbi:hypothetical protein RBH94_15140 [Aestuariibaculum sp. YM273]|uniref:hypothetical protein n=1 Tax=Aestuariibaculum sp. YM273 TaxID=3070659 RepID=UPI0027DB1334|nr:hypothetical protein [Aestuariibaculum sp. YM273]WMI65386.1 hypothetical protein RBH94_15140 [Aestuariibaculum sp. YM273]
MTTEELQKLQKEEVKDFIRQRLGFDEGVTGSMRYMKTELPEKQHKRFDMSGYESKTGQCTVWNMSVLNEFADLGIYDYTTYLFLDFYKGTPTIYLQYFYENDNIEIEGLSGYGTTDLIYKIFELTIFSNKDKRRRN